MIPTSPSISGKISLRLPSANLAIAFAAFLLFAATAAYYNLPKPETENMNFGWEYGNIAEALVQGRGYSDPFGVGSGPTAWMPPLYVFLLAGAFRLFGVKSIAALWAILLLKYLALAAALYCLLTIAAGTRYRRYRYALAPVYVLLIFINRNNYFRGLHDDWLILFFSCWMLLLLTTHLHGGSKSNTLFLGILAAILPLASPALAAAFLLAWIGLLIVGIRAGSTDQSRMQVGILIGALFATSILLWTARNYQAFGTLIPLKSNLWFDFYQANYLDDDGLTTQATFLLFHPIDNNEVREEYFLEKEAAFMRNYKDRSLEQLSNDPFDLLPKIARRAISAFLYMHYSADLIPMIGTTFFAEEIQKLDRARMIYTREPPKIVWTSLSLPEDEFKRRIEVLALDDEVSILADRREAIRLLYPPERAWKRAAKSLLLSFIPTLCILCGLLMKRIRGQVSFLLGVLIYLAYLAPYILVSHYDRYQTPLIGLHSFFIFLVACALFEKLRFGNILP